MSADLVAFLRARLNEDEQAARAALDVNVLAAMGRGKPAPRWVPSPEGDAGIWDTEGIPRVKFAWARERDHIVRHDPARVLAETAAKREVVRLAERAYDYHETFMNGFAAVVVVVLRLLAAPHADHPDYRPEWAPDA